MTVIVAGALIDTRLDRALRQLVPGESRAALQRFIRGGRVTLDGVVALDPAQHLRAGQHLVVQPPAVVDPAAPGPRAENIALEILHADDDVIVLVKRAGMVVHPTVGVLGGTLVNALLHHFGPLPIGGTPDDAARYDQPGIVHRLDRDTSGVMVVARSARAHAALIAQFAVHAIERAYLALAHGVGPATHTYDTLHGRHPVDRRRFSSHVRDGLRAVTHVERIEAHVRTNTSLLRCRLETGRTHQIRVHLSEAGHPLLADGMYGHAGLIVTPTVQAISTTLRRQALHAGVLGFTHPDGRTLRFETALPDDMATALAALRSS